MKPIPVGFRNRLHNVKHQRRIKRALRAPYPTEFVNHPEPTTPGDYARGLRLLNGEIFQDNQILNVEGSIWDYQFPSEYFSERFQAFDWMDDLAAVKTSQSNRLMKQWSNDWIERYGRGQGSAWRADLIGWRVIRLITHATTLLSGASSVQYERYFESLGIQTHYLTEIIDDAADGLPRILSYVAWLFAAISLNSFNDDVETVMALLDDECAELVDRGRIFFDARNPEELSQIFSLLVWADNVLSEYGYEPRTSHDQAIDVIGQNLRALRFGGHNLLPAQGGGLGDADEIDRALTQAQILGQFNSDEVIGFHNVRVGALNAFVDVSSPPSGPDHPKTHASTLALWVAERDQVLIDAGGAPLQAPLVKRVEMQETACHSTLVISDQSSSELNLLKDQSGRFTVGAIINAPAFTFDHQRIDDDTSIHLAASHDGYLERFGYNHQRKLVFDRDGLYFGGLDILEAPNRKAQKQVKSLLARRKNFGIPLDIYFHLGPTIKASLDNNGDMVSFRSNARHLWIFRQEGGKIDLIESEYYFPDRMLPRTTQSIVIRTRLTDVSGFVSWSFQAYPEN